MLIYAKLYTLSVNRLPEFLLPRLDVFSQTLLLPFLSPQ